MADTTGIVRPVPVAIEREDRDTWPLPWPFVIFITIFPFGVLLGGVIVASLGDAGFYVVLAIWLGGWALFVAITASARWTARKLGH